MQQAEAANASALQPDPNTSIPGELPGGRARDLKHLWPATWSADLDRVACELPAGSGSASGVCAEVEHVQAQLTFCKDAVQYRACVPADQPLWPNWNMSAKDRMLSEIFKEKVEARLAMEVNVTPHQYVKIRLVSNPPCFAAFKNALCWYNFPKCNDANVSLPLCRSSCDRYYAACRYQVDQNGQSGICQPDSVATSGLFEAGTPGSDQRLAEFSGEVKDVCPSTRARWENMSDAEDLGNYWLVKTWYGISLMVVLVAIVVVTGFRLLVPYGIRVKVIWLLDKIFKCPYRIYMVSPRWSTGSCIALFAFVFLLLVLFGAYRRLQYSLADFKLTEAVVVDAVAQSSQAAYTAPMRLPLSFTQEKQLVGSCVCTGRARHHAGDAPYRVATIAAVIAVLVHPLTPTNTP